MHGMKETDPGFAGFGEAYFSTVEHGSVKGWKRHRQMTLNFIVPCGDIQVSVCDEMSGLQKDFRLNPSSDEAYNRLTIPPGLWVAFGGLGSGANLLLNLASMVHDPAEADNRSLDAFAWRWIG